MSDNEISVDLSIGRQGPDSATVDVFCGIQRILGKRYPDRGIDQAGLNNLIRLIAELENAYRLLEVAKS